MSGPNPGRRNQSIAFVLMVVGVLVLIGGAILTSSAVTAVGWAAVCVGAVLYVVTRFESSRSPREDPPPVDDGPEPQ